MASRMCWLMHGACANSNPRSSRHRSAVRTARRAPAPRSSSPTIPDSEAAAPGTAATSPPPFPPPMLAVPIVPPPPKGAARDAAGLAGAGPRSGSLAEPATVADPFAFSGAAGVYKVIQKHLKS